MPNTDVRIQGGSGAVDGISLVTGQDVFAFAGGRTSIESSSDINLQTTGHLGAVASAGVVFGTPASIQASAGGAVQLYAGAGVAPALGDSGGPGDPVNPSEPAEVKAGQTADALTRMNDGLKAVGDMAGATLDARDGLAAGEAGDTAEGALGAVKGAFGYLKGAWDLGSAATGSPSSASAKESAGTVKTGLTGGESALAAVEGGMQIAAGDTAGGVANVATAASKLAGLGGGGAPMSGDELDAAKAQQRATVDAANTGDGVQPVEDGPRIHAVAPANIDRECGADMTAKVAGNKDSKVDGDIKYASGKSISMKAFSKVETSSLNFEAYANVGATMKGLATAKVESLGQAVMEGKAKFHIATKATGTIEATELNVEAKGNAIIHSPTIDIGSGTLTIDSETTIKKKTTVDGFTKLRDKLWVEKNTRMKGKLKVDKKIQAAGHVTTQGKFKNRNFKA